MKTVLVTSAVTFVPNNYDGFVLEMAKDPSICALVVIDNRSWDIVFKALLLILSGAAPAMGATLIKNHFSASLARRKKVFEDHGKKYYLIKDINEDQILKEIEQLQPDVILNARTRSFYKKKLLALPRLGCINIHHGLLPHQRGLMCDFWAHLLSTPAGFSIHQMTSKLDDGAILSVVEVSTDKKDYLKSIEVGAREEARSAKAVLADIAQHNELRGQENIHSTQTVYRSNPHLSDFYKMRRKGIKI